LIKEKWEFEVVITNREPGPGGFEGCVDLGGKTDLETLAGVLSRAEIFISRSQLRIVLRFPTRYRAGEMGPPQEYG